METLLNSTDINALVQRASQKFNRDGETSGVASVITSILQEEGVDLRHEPALEEVKCLLVDVHRAISETQCVATNH